MNVEEHPQGRERAMNQVRNDLSGNKPFKKAKAALDEVLKKEAVKKASQAVPQAEESIEKDTGKESRRR